MKCLVTGATGFIGSYLVEALHRSDWEVSALVRDIKKAQNLLPTNVRFIQGSVEENGACEKAISISQPDRIFHLAAQSYPQLAWKDPKTTFSINILGTLNLLEAVRHSGNQPTVVIAGSSAEYGTSSEGRPLSENNLLEPATLYGVSKLAAGATAGSYARRYAMRIIQVRPFFLIGPRKTGDVCSDLARGIVAIERGHSSTLRVGNLEITRDFLDINDGVDALMVIAEKGQAGEAYNICSGRGHRLRDVLDQLKSAAGIRIEEIIDPNLLRPIDEMVRIGDPSKLVTLGWQPHRSLNSTLISILDYWRGVP